MTHERLVLECSSRINLVVGANGSGKSSVVCAICLGLGGQPALMEREDRAAGFIRAGQTRATIEIAVQGEGDYEYLVKTVIDSGGGGGG
jgi:chromosome segregation ATPase